MIRRPRRPRSYEASLTRLSWAAGAPGAILALVLVWTSPYSLMLRVTLTLLLLLATVWGVSALRRQVVHPLRALANLLEALRLGDYSLRARDLGHTDVLGEVLWEVNALRDALERERMGALEATALLKRVMEEIGVAVFAFDHERRLSLVNRAGERLLAQPARRLLGRNAEEIGLGDSLSGSPSRTFQAVFPGGSGRFQMRRSTFREEGRPHALLVITDLSQTLREEERQAWRRLIRVLGHELNNSLAPIKSMAGTLQALLAREPRPSDWQDDMERGLHVIGERSESLSRFMSSYARLARLPAPELEPVSLPRIVRRTAALETRLSVEVEDGPDATLAADADQIEQALINLIRNAADAALTTDGGVRVGWRHAGPQQMEIYVEDDGPGLSNPDNVFVPFYTTKPGGTGIGLALSRQIAEAHGGTLAVDNRSDAPGCRAEMRLPMS